MHVRYARDELPAMYPVHHARRLPRAARSARVQRAFGQHAVEWRVGRVHGARGARQVYSRPRHHAQLLRVFQLLHSRHRAVPVLRRKVVRRLLRVRRAQDGPSGVRCARRRRASHGPAG